MHVVSAHSHIYTLFIIHLCTNSFELINLNKMFNSLLICLVCVCLCVQSSIFWDVILFQLFFLCVCFKLFLLISSVFFCFSFLEFLHLFLKFYTHIYSYLIYVYMLDKRCDNNVLFSICFFFLNRVHLDFFSNLPLNHFHFFSSSNI